MMRHIELNFYWLYEYIRGDGSKFVTTEELDELEMVLNDAKLKNKVQIHYEAEEKDVKSKQNDMTDACIASYMDMARDRSNLITPLVGPGDGLTIKNFDEMTYSYNRKWKKVYSIMEVISEDGRLSVKQVFSFETECEAEIVLDYVNELEPERKFYIREGQGE
jgi:hypothetical protein